MEAPYWMTPGRNQGVYVPNPSKWKNQARKLDAALTHAPSKKGSVNFTYKLWGVAKRYPIGIPIFGTGSFYGVAFSTMPCPVHANSMIFKTIYNNPLCGYYLTWYIN